LALQALHCINARSAAANRNFKVPISRETKVAALREKLIATSTLGVSSPARSAADYEAEQQRLTGMKGEQDELLTECGTMRVSVRDAEKYRDKSNCVLYSVVTDFWYSIPCSFRGPEAVGALDGTIHDIFCLGGSSSSFHIY
jgi:hypothetical protein